MDYRGVRYSIRMGIARSQWIVCVHPPTGDLERAVKSRAAAETRARSMINAAIEHAIATCPLTAAVKARMQGCILQLEALGNCGPTDEPLLFAGATPRGALVFAALELPPLPSDEQRDRAAVALQLHRAIGNRG